ncbi:hypothetical protein HELRODRAFT_162275 [Helobdella robusta]|uniref:DNTTIP1 dimerisation domain-containing protein n=1 Tax=Helobdella robusta TaxID=6412 RepID=T1ESF9_HELRO|nr:hypothetical protein HELRODRAFT_162275 [Helobdella robusta]ESN98815.1 hypothetical protein HELRODRAFT_162275 [Helobdella robusta]
MDEGGLAGLKAGSFSGIFLGVCLNNRESMDFTTNNSSASHKALAALLINGHQENKYDVYKSCFNEYSSKTLEPLRIFNRRLSNINNFPYGLVNSKNSRHSTFNNIPWYGLCQNTAQSLDMLRQVIQSSINDEISKIIKKYLNLNLLILLICFKDVVCQP